MQNLQNNKYPKRSFSDTSYMKKIYILVFSNVWCNHFTIELLEFPFLLHFNVHFYDDFKCSAFPKNIKNNLINTKLNVTH